MPWPPRGAIAFGPLRLPPSGDRNCTPFSKTVARLSCVIWDNHAVLIRDHTFGTGVCLCYCCEFIPRHRRRIGAATGRGNSGTLRPRRRRPSADLGKPARWRTTSSESSARCVRRRALRVFMLMTNDDICDVRETSGAALAFDVVPASSGSNRSSGSQVILANCRVRNGFDAGLR